MNKLKKTVAYLLSFFMIEKLPIKEGKLDFSEDQRKKLDAKIGEEMSENIINSINAELEKAAQSEEDTQALEEIRAELREALKDTNMSEDEVIYIVSAEAKEGEKETSKDLTAEVRKLTTQVIEGMKKQDKLIQKLINDPEPDEPITSGEVKNQKVKHSNTHLFAEKASYNAFEDRPWNQRAAGITNRATNFDSNLVVEQLNKDLDDFYRENPEVIRSLQMDKFGLPEFWPKRLGVRDEVSEATIVTDEITQARTANWLPKNKQRIKPENRKVFGIKIDAEWSGYRLQLLEASWISMIVNSGSQAYKLPFVGFLVTEIYKKARVEDRIASIKGVYTETPEDATEPGRFIDRQDGLLIRLYRARQQGRYKVAPQEVPTAINIYDHVRNMIEANLPKEVKNRQDLIYYLSPTHLRWYKERYRQLHGVEMDFKTGDTLTIPNYPNIRFVELVDLEGLNYHFITFSDNIIIDEDVPSEKSTFHLEKLKRDIFVFGDYKMGCGPRVIGTKVSDNDPDAFKVQLVWDNGMPMFKDDFFVPGYQSEGDTLRMSYKNLYVTDGLEEEIKDLKGTFKGEVIKIRANTTAKGEIKNGGNFTLDSTFKFNSGKTLVLYNNGTKFVELNRYDNASQAFTEDVHFDHTGVNAADGNVQVYQKSEDGAQTLVGIEGGSEGQELRLVGSDDTNTVAVSDATENVTLASGTATLKKDKTIDLVFVEGKWVETARNV